MKGMTDWLSEMSNEEADAWGETMLAHAFEEREWKSGRDRLQELLEADGKRADESSLRSYLSCCAESVGGSHPLPSLASFVEELYGAYGMENAKDSIN
jgi:hypothetical protein